MSDHVKGGASGRRPYDASRRQEQARATRRAVLDAARRRFLDEGYGGTTVAAVAADAGVSVETVYKAFGNKAKLVKAVFDVAIVGDDEPIPLMQRDTIARLQAEADGRRKFELYGDHLVDLAPRTNPILLVVRAAAATDQGAAEVWAQLQHERLTGMTHFAADLHGNGLLRAGVSKAEARDVLWTYNSVELWDLLVNQRGWPTRRWGRFVAQQLAAALL